MTRWYRRQRNVLSLSMVLIIAACSSPVVTTAPGGSGNPQGSSSAATAAPPSSGDGASPPAEARAKQLPSRASLIQQAVADGRIDDVTALDYRVRAMFGLNGLPEEFAGGVPRSDSAALTQIASMIDHLSSADQSRLRPYLLRPTEAGSPFSTLTGQVASIAGPMAPIRPMAAAPAACTKWLDSGNRDQRFKVWACGDTDAQAAESDIAAIVTLVDRYWDKMSTDMGGPPLPDAYGANVPAQYGGDARIDFYALHMGETVYRDGANSIPAGAAAATVPAPPFTNPDGTPRNASSAFLLLNVDTLKQDATSFELDLIHEFFHALQDAHNQRAIEDGTNEHWFVEASATWAETYYLRSASDEPHGWFYTFQDERLGLSDNDLDHQYASYVWPFFMEQEKSAQAIFDAWKATDPIAPRNFAAVTAAVDAQVPFDTKFREFAVRNVNLNAVLKGAGLRRYDDLDANFYDDWPPFAMIPSDVSPGSPYTSSDPIPALAAYYYTPTFSDDARKITISTGGQVDGDFLAHYADGTWKHIPIDGVLKFCRDDPGWDIDSGILVASNHGVQGPVSGNVEISAKEKCTGDVRLKGTFTGHFEDFLSKTDATFNVIVVWKKGPNDVHDRLAFTFESGSYTFSTVVGGVCGGTRSEGGSLKPFDPAEPTSLLYGDPQERSYQVAIAVTDQRLNQQGIWFNPAASFDIPNGSLGCEVPYQSKGLVPVCPMEFKQLTADTFETTATCRDGYWTGKLVEQSGPEPS